MRNLLRKEFSLAMHPITPMMLLLSAMVLIPNYPYAVMFFYVSMALFFTCLLGRENNDVIYSLNLPISKKDIVKARFMFTVLIQMAQMVLMIPFTILSQKLNEAGNQAGMDANLSLFGVGFLVFGLFNAIFFGSYYKDVTKVGISFVKASIMFAIYVVFDVISTYTIPLVKDYLDTKDPEFLSYKLIFFAVCLIVYMLLTFCTYRISVKNFEKQDLN